MDGWETGRSEYDSKHQRSLMNLMEEFYGAVSDLQVWFRLLDDDEVLQWLQCRSSMGDLFIWLWRNLVLGTVKQNKINNKPTLERKLNPMT